jgi:hypothetical protein
MAGNIGCFVEGCDKAVVGQCSGYEASCGQFYSKAHSEDKLCAECGGRQEMDRLFLDYLETAERIPRVGCVSTIVALVFVGLGALAFVQMVAAGHDNPVNYGIWLGMLFIGGMMLLTKLNKINSRPKIIAETEKAKPGFVEFYEMWKKEKRREHLRAGLRTAGGLAVATVVGGVAATNAVASSVMQAEMEAANRARYGTPRDVADAVRDLERKL